MNLTTAHDDSCRCDECYAEFVANIDWADERRRAARHIGFGTFVFAVLYLKNRDPLTGWLGLVFAVLLALMLWRVWQDRNDTAPQTPGAP